MINPGLAPWAMKEYRPYRALRCLPPPINSCAILMQFPRLPDGRFGGLEKSLYLCIVFKRKPLQARSCKHAEVAQLVEHNLAKVRVAGSSPVFRSKKTLLAIRFGRLHFCAQNGVEQLRVLVVDKSKEYY